MTRQPTTLVELFEATLERPERAFITGVDDLQSYTYGEAWNTTGQLANSFQQHRVGLGDRVVLHLAKSSQALLVYLACARAGAVLVPLNPGATDPELAHLLADSAPSLIIADDERPIYATAGCPVLVLSQTIARARREATPDFDNVAITPSDLAALVYTSGTTGKPKGAMISHANLTSNALALVTAWGFTSNDVLLHALPIFHVHGLFVATNTVLASGASMRMAAKFDPDMVLDQLPHSSVLMGVPTFYTRLLAEPRFDQQVCRSIRLFISGSAPLLATTHVAFEQRTGQKILERYGMTETSMLTSNPLSGPRKPGTVGPALPGVHVRVVEANSGLELAQGEIGQIEVEGPNVFNGYWRRPDLTGTEFCTDGFFRTGDIGTFDSDGYLSIVGRSKDLIISGGFNVYPKEIEEAIDARVEVLESAVIGVPDPDFGEAVVAVVVAAAGQRVDPEDLRLFLRADLASYKLPKQIHVVESLPRNALGKVEKARLRTIFGPSEPGIS